MKTRDRGAIVDFLASLSPYRADHLRQAARFDPEVLEEIAQDPTLSPSVRGVAAGALGLSPSPNSIPVLLRLAEASERVIWESAITALGRLAKKEQAARDGLLSLVSSSREEIQADAVVKLAAIPEMRQALWEAMGDRENALIAFLLTASPRPVDFQKVEGLLQHSSPTVRLHACDWFASHAFKVPPDVRRRVIACAEKQIWRERGIVVSAMVRMLDAMRKVEETSGARNAC